MKKLVSLLLALMMVLAMGATAVAEEPVTVTIAVLQHGSDAVTDFNQKYAIKAAEEATGVHVEWTYLVSGQTAEKLATLLAGDLPDAFLGLLDDSQIMNNSSMFVTLDDKLDLVPNIMATYEEGFPGWRTFLTYPDGHIYGLMSGYLFTDTSAIQGTMWIRKDWLDVAGLPVPTTLEELEEALIAFRDLDVDGDGDPTNEIPWDWAQSHYAAQYKEIGYMFGVPNFYDIVDGKVLPTSNTDAFRASLEYMHRLTSEGLMNLEGLTQTEEQYNANISNGKVGVFLGWAPYTYTADKELQNNYVPVGPLSLDGYTFRVTPNNMTGRRNGLVITSECENVEAILKWWDYMSRDQAAAHAGRNGPEGLTWEIVDGVYSNRAYTAEEATAFGYGDLAGHAGTSTFAASMGLTLCQPLCIDPLAPVEGTTGGIRYSAVKMYEPYFTQTMSKGIVPAEAQEEFDFTCEGLEDAVNKFAAESILNGVTDEGWEAYKKELNNLNYEYYIEHYQKMLDGSF